MRSPSRTSSEGTPAPGCDVSVITSGHDVADARLHRIVGALARVGLSVEVLAVGDFRGGPAGAAVRTWPRRGLIARAVRSVVLPWCARGAILLTFDPDAAIGTVPAAFVRNRLHVADVHEDYAELLRDRAWARGWRGRIAARVARLAVLVSERAALTVVADEHLPPPANRCHRRLVVRNLPDLSMLASSRREADHGPPRAVYVGDVRRSRGLETMVEAIAAAPPWVLDVIGPLARDDAGWLERRLRQGDVADRIRLHGRQPPERAWHTADGASVGLALLEDTPAYRAAIPTKVYEYLAAGMAVLATPLPRVHRFLADAGAGEVVLDAQGAARALRHWAGPGAPELARLRDAARAWRDTLEASESPYDQLAHELVTLRQDAGQPRATSAMRRRTMPSQRAARQPTDSNWSLMPTRLAARIKRRAMTSARGISRPMIDHRESLPAPVRTVLRGVHRALPVRIRRALRNPSVPPQTTEELPPRPPVRRATVRLLIGPANFAGQGWQWARAVERHLPDVAAEAYAFVKGSLDFPVDYGVPVAMYANSAQWQQDQERHILSSYTHVLVEAERPVLGTRYGSTCDGELRVLLKGGLKVGFIAHGSDVRIPSRHVQENEWSPFVDTSWEVVPVLERNATRNVEIMAAYDGHLFVSTPDLLGYVQRSVWCPVIVEPEVWATDDRPMQRQVPLAVHAPSNERIKGSDLIDPVLQELADRGLIEYRRIRSIDPQQMPDVYRRADIVLDQFRIGGYGVAACEAMAAGRIVLGHITPEVRQTIVEHTGMQLPIIEATPATVQDVLLRLIDDRSAAITSAAAGPAFVDAVHDGRRSAKALAPFLLGDRA